MRQLFRELKRRDVCRVAVTYAAGAFVTLQAARLVFPPTILEGLHGGTGAGRAGASRRAACGRF